MAANVAGTRRQAFGRLHFGSVSGRQVVRASRAAAAVTLALAASALTACAPEQAPEPVSLTITSAAATYLEEVCPVNDAWDDLDFAVDQLRLTLDAADRSGEAGPVADALARYEIALESLGAQSLAAAEALESPERRWPQGAARPVRDVAQSLRDDSAEATRLSGGDAATAAAAVWPQVTESAHSAAAARAALALPADSAAACAERPKSAPPTQDSQTEGTKP